MPAGSSIDEYQKIDMEKLNNGDIVEVPVKTSQEYWLLFSTKTDPGYVPTCFDGNTAVMGSFNSKNLFLVRYDKSSGQLYVNNETVKKAPTPFQVDNNFYSKLWPVYLEPGSPKASSIGEFAGSPSSFLAIHHDAETISKKLLQGVQGDGFLEKSPPGRRRQGEKND